MIYMRDAAILYTRYCLLYKGGDYMDLLHQIALLNICKALTLCQILCGEVAV